MSNARTSREKRPSDEGAPSGAPDIQRARPEQLRDGYLNRLRRLLRLRRDHFEELNDQGLRLLDRSIFAAYCDCIDIGQGDAARDVLKDVRLTVSLARGKR
jgi:hypothetical protein